MAAPADPKHSPGFKAWTITQVNPVFAGKINKVQEQIPLCSCQHLSGCGDAALQAWLCSPPNPFSINRKSLAGMPLLQIHGFRFIPQKEHFAT